MPAAAALCREMAAQGRRRPDPSAGAGLAPCLGSYQKQLMPGHVGALALGGRAPNVPVFVGLAGGRGGLVASCRASLGG